MLTHFSLFTGIGGIDFKKLLNVIADVRVKTNDILIQKIADKAFKFSVIFTVLVLRANYEILWLAGFCEMWTLGGPDRRVQRRGKRYAVVS